jgi:hypothetical protein
MFLNIMTKQAALPLYVLAGAKERQLPLNVQFSQEIQDSLGAQVPFPSRLREPHEFASLGVHICENQMLNGEVIRLDGAIRMNPALSLNPKDYVMVM